MVGLDEKAIIYDGNKMMCKIKCIVVSDKAINLMYNASTAYIDWRLQILTDWDIPPIASTKQDIEAGRYTCFVRGEKYAVQSISKHDDKLIKGNKPHYVRLLTLT